MSKHLTFTILLQLAEQYRELIEEFRIGYYPSNLTPNTLERATHNTKYWHINHDSDVVEAINDIILTYSKFYKGLND